MNRMNAITILETEFKDQKTSNLFSLQSVFFKSALVQKKMMKIYEFKMKKKNDFCYFLFGCVGMKFVYTYLKIYLFLTIFIFKYFINY